MARTFIIIAIVLILLIVIGGGLWWYFRNKKDIKVEVKPKTATVANGKTATFSAGDTKVTWSVSSSSLGDITSGGVFTAKGSSGTVTVTATSIDDTSKKDIATVTLTSAGDGTTPGSTPGTPGSTPTNGTITITPSSATVQNNTTQQFTSNIPVNWSVSNSTMGSIDANGLFTAKVPSGSVTVTATSKTDSTKKSSATIQLAQYSGPGNDKCNLGGEFVRCDIKGPTISPEISTPFEVMCPNGEYVDALSGAGSKATHGIGIKCSGLGGEQYFGSRKDNYFERIGWKDGKPPVGGYQRLEPWYGQSWNSVGRLNIYDKAGELYYLGAQTDNPRTDMDCGKDGVISGVFGTTNGGVLNTIGVRCSYKN